MNEDANEDIYEDTYEITNEITNEDDTKKIELLLKKRDKSGLNYFINTFNIRKIEAKYKNEKEVIMEDYLYILLGNSYYYIKNKFIEKKYGWKLLSDIGYIIISWE